MDKRRFLSIGKRLAGLIALLLTFLVGISAQQLRPIYENPALAGDYPDPSIIRVGKDYWATSTSSEWAPEFPLLHSRDLVNWKIAGAVFEHRPEWSTGNYWAPEIAAYRGRYFVYYVGHRKDGPLCVAVATSARPSGPYQDHGPLVCQQDGSIDPVPVTDERGNRYLVWKEDGNSVQQPTPIWAQRLSGHGTKLVGEKKELIRNDAGWEAQLVEGPYILRRNGWFFLFYSGNACCGRDCHYAMGVARSRTLLGRWEKYSSNPILQGNETWKCPGHGSIVVDPKGRDFLLYHAYKATNFVYVGRQAMLDEVKWGANGWPSINEGKGPSVRASAPLRISGQHPEYSFFDDFTSPRLRTGWQWPQSNEPIFHLEAAHGGWLILSPGAGARAGDIAGAIMARSTTEGDYVATTAIDSRQTSRDASAGLAAYGDGENALGIARGTQLVVWKREKNKDQIIAQAKAPDAARTLLRMTARDGHFFRFAFSVDGHVWSEIGPEVDGSYLPPWDRGVRIALTVSGNRDSSGRFDSLRVSRTN